MTSDFDSQNSSSLSSFEESDLASRESDQSSGESSTSPSRAMAAAFEIEQRIGISAGETRNKNSSSLCDSLLYISTIGDFLTVGLLRLVSKEKAPRLQYVLIATLTIYIFIVILWLPIFVLSMVLGENGVYLALACSIIWLGRSIIRMIAFPGASNRVLADIQGEFAKHSMRCLEAASEEIQELSQLVTATNGAQYALEVSWKRVCMYRRRVIAVLLQVIYTLLQDEDPIFGCDENYENNPLVGDDLGYIPPHVVDDANDLCQILSRVLSVLNKIEPHVKMCIAFKDSSRFSSSSSRAYQKFLSERIDSRVEETAKELSRASMDLRDLLPSLHPDARRSSSNDHASDEHPRMSNLEAMQASVSSIIPFFDPPLYSSPFSLDVMRCCVLSRYRGSKQFCQVQRRCVEIVYGGYSVRGNQEPLFLLRICSRTLMGCF